MDRGSQLDEEDEEDDEEEDEEDEEERRRRRTRQEEATDIKSNNPHLAGGEKRCQHMLENPTCKTGNAYQGGIVLQGWHPTQCKCIQWKYGTIWVRGRTAKSRLGPVCGCGS